MEAAEKIKGKAHSRFRVSPFIHLKVPQVQTDFSHEAIFYRGPVRIEIGRNSRLDG